MAYNFIECDREQQYLMPPSVKEWLPEGDLSWFVIDAVEQMELKEFYSKYRGDGCGRAAFNPKMMVSLLLYGYSVGIEDKLRSGLVDAGYWSEGNLKKELPDELELYAATKKDGKQCKEIREQKASRGRIPEGLSERERMERKLLTNRGKQMYSKRGQMIESVFGQIKDARGISRFLRRGLNACASEWKLICATHNLLKLFRSRKASWA